jgi:transposase-like protein
MRVNAAIRVVRLPERVTACDDDDMNSVNDSDMPGSVRDVGSPAVSLARVAAIDALRAAVRTAAARKTTATTTVAAAVHAAYAAGATVQQIADTLGIGQANTTRTYGPFRADRYGPRQPVGGDVIDRVEGVAAALRHVREENTKLKDAGAVVDVKVNAAREVGCTWTSIADVLGKARSNVVEEYRHLRVETPARTRVKLTREQRLDLTRRVRAGESITDLAAESGASERYVRWLKTQGPTE